MSSVNLTVSRPVYSLPSNFPTATRCYQIEIPDDPYYAAQLVGAIERMAWWFSYDRDNARTGKQVAALWKTALATLKECQPAPPPSSGGCDCDCEDCMKYQQVGCLLQVQDCLTGQFVTIFDATKCFPNTAPGGGTTPPGAGVCQNYTMQFQANVLTVLPFVVNTGDVLTISSLNGAGSDGSPTWYCPPGSVFFGGACVGGQHTVSGDPLNTSPHMCIVIKIGSTYYPFFTTTPFTVPSGITNQQVFIGVNDAPIGDDAGTYSIAFQYCNNQTPPSGTWRAHINFALNSGGFSAVPLSPGPSVGLWQGGTGWTGTAGEPNSGAWVHGIYIKLPFAASHLITSCEVKGTQVQGSVNNSASNCLYIDDGATFFIPTKTFATMPSSPFDITGSPSGAASPFVEIIFYDAEFGSPATPGTSTLTDLYLAGTGTIPPELAPFSY